MTIEDIPREDTLPDRRYDEKNWRDTGCKLHPSCLACPRPLCFYDEKESMAGRPASKLGVVPDLRGLVNSVGARAVAEMYGLSTRTVHRELARRRNGTAVRDV